MEDYEPLQITVWSKDYVRRGVVGAPRDVDVTIRSPGPGDATFTVDADHPRIDDLTAAGARAVITYQYSATATETVLLSGLVSEDEGAGSDVEGSRTFTVEDDWEDIFNDTIGWPNPTGSVGADKIIAGQGGEDTFFSRTGPAETVLKQIVTPNVTREGKPLSIPATTGKGSTVTVAVRMDKLSDKLFPIVDQAGIVVRVLQQGAVRTLLVTSPTVYPRELTSESGIVVDGSFKRTQAAFTSVIVATPSGDVDRAFKIFTNAAVITATGIKKCGFIEVSGDGDDLETLMAQEAQQFLTDNGPSVSLSIELAETDSWRFGKTFQLGDKVTVSLRNSGPLTDYVREVNFSWGDDGLTVTPRVGNWDESRNAALIKEVTQMGKAFRVQQRNR